MKDWNKNYILDIKGLQTEPLTAEEIVLQFRDEHESQGIYAKIVGSNEWMELSSIIQNLNIEAQKNFNSFTQNINESVDVEPLAPKLRLVKSQIIDTPTTEEENQDQEAHQSQSTIFISNPSSSSGTNYNPTPSAPQNISNIKTSLITILMLAFIISVILFGYLFFVMKQSVSGIIQSSDRDNIEFSGTKYKIDILSEKEALTWKNALKPELDKLSLKYKSTHEAINPKRASIVQRTNQIIQKYSVVTAAMIQAKRSATILSIHFDKKNESDNLELRKLESAIDIAGSYIAPDIANSLYDRKFDLIVDQIRKSGFDTIRKKVKVETEELKLSIEETLNDAAQISNESEALINNKLFKPNNEFEREDECITNTSGEFKLNLRPGRYIMYVNPKNDINEIKLPKYWAKQILIKSTSANTLIIQENEQSIGYPLSVWNISELKNLKTNQDLLRTDIESLNKIKKEIDDLISKIDSAQRTDVKID